MPLAKSQPVSNFDLVSILKICDIQEIFQFLYFESSNLLKFWLMIPKKKIILVK